jgi:WD40 repeat protein
MTISKRFPILWAFTCVIACGAALETTRAQETKEAPKPAKNLTGLAKYILGINFSPDAKLVAAGGGAGTLCIWETESGKLFQKIEPKGGGGPRGFGNAVFHCSFHPDGNLLAYCGSGATVLKKGKDGFEPFQALAPGQKCRGISFAPDGKTLLVGANGPACNVSVFKTDSWEKAMTLSGRHYAAEAVPVDPTGTYAASGAGKGVVVWDLKAGGKAVATLSGHAADVESSAWHPTKKILAAGDRAHTIVIWDVEKKEAIRRIDTHANQEMKPPMMPVEFLIFDPKGAWLAATTLDGMLKIYLADSYAEKVSIHPQGDDVKRKGQVGLAASPDGVWLAAGGGDMNQIVTLWKVSDLLGK